MKYVSVVQEVFVELHKSVLCGRIIFEYGER